MVEPNSIDEKVTTDKVRISTYVDQKVKEEAEQIAEEEDRSLSNYLEHLIKQDIARRKKKKQVQE